MNEADQSQQQYMMEEMKRSLAQANGTSTQQPLAVAHDTGEAQLSILFPLLDAILKINCSRVMKNDEVQIQLKVNNPEYKQCRVTKNGPRC